MIDSYTSSSNSTSVLTDLAVFTMAFAFFLKFILPVLLLIYLMIINSRIKDIKEMFEILVEYKIHDKKESLESKIESDENL